MIRIRSDPALGAIGHVGDLDAQLVIEWPAGGDPVKQVLPVIGLHHAFDGGSPTPVVGGAKGYPPAARGGVDRMSLQKQDRVLGAGFIDQEVVVVGEEGDGPGQFVGSGTAGVDHA